MIKWSNELSIDDGEYTGTRAYKQHKYLLETLQDNQIKTNVKIDFFHLFRSLPIFKSIF